MREGWCSRGLFAENRLFFIYTIQEYNIVVLLFCTHLMKVLIRYMCFANRVVTLLKRRVKTLSTCNAVRSRAIK